LSEEKLPLLKEENTLLAEVGPIKYIAEAIYDKEDPDFIDKAVRVVIIVIIVVFDPLAILLLIAANQSFRSLKKEEEKLEEEPKKKANRKRKLDNVSTISVESFVDDRHQMVPKNKITTLDGGSF